MQHKELNKIFFDKKSKSATQFKKKLEVKAKKCKECSWIYSDKKVNDKGEGTNNYEQLLATTRAIGKLEGAIGNYDDMEAHPRRRDIHEGATDEGDINKGDTYYAHKK